MNTYLMLAGLLLISIIAYIVIIRILEVQWSNKRKRLSSFLKDKEEEKQTNRLFELLERKGILQYISPSYVIKESEYYGQPITKNSYFSTFIFGTLIALVIMIVYFQPVIFLLPIVFIGGVIATNVRLHNIKKEQLALLDSKLGIYMSSVSTSMMTYNNIRDSLNSVLPSLENPVKKDVEEALIALQDGKELRIAFAKMNQKYPQRQVKLFHEKLDAIVKSGSTDMEALRKTAEKMKKKEIFRRKLRTIHKESKKVWKTFVFLPLSLPFLFIIYSMDNYLVVMNHIAMSGAFALTFLAIFIAYRKLEQLEVYDPTSDSSADFK